MPPRIILSGLLLLSPLAASGAAGREANIFYFDHDYRISFQLASGLENLAHDDKNFRIESVTTEVSYTDGRRFLTENAQGLTAADLNGTTNYAKTGETDILLGGKSILSASARLSPALQDLLIKSLPPYILTVKKARADLVTGITPGGKTFTALDLKTTSPTGSWMHTIDMKYAVDAGGQQMALTESCFPMGMSGFSRRVLKETADKEKNILVSLGLGGKLVSTVIGMPMEKVIARLEKRGTDIAALDPEDIMHLWRWFSKRSGPVSTGKISFICSNIEATDAEFSTLIKPYVIKELDGVRTAFISFIPSAPERLADLAEAPVKVRNPINTEFRSSLVEKLRSDEKAKVIVALSNMEEDLDQLLKIPGVDIVLGLKSWERDGTRREEVHLGAWETEAHTLPAAVVFRDARGLGEVKLGLTEGGGLRTIRSASVPLSPEDTLHDAEDDQIKEQIIRYFFGTKEALLPDIRRLYKDLPDAKPVYSQLDFRNLVVSILRKQTGAEISFVKIQPFSNNILGDLPASMVKSWLGEDDKVVKARVPGGLIRELLPKFDFALTPDDGTGYQKYRDKEYLAVSGLDPEGRISGLPLSDSEYYLAAFPASFLRETEKYPQLRYARVAGYESRTLNAIVLEALERTKQAAANGAWEAAIRELIENKPVRKPVWRLNLRDISLQMSETGVRNTENFSQVSDSRLRTAGQTFIQGAGKLFSEYYNGNLRFDTGISADYGKLILRPKGQERIETESVDSILLEAELRHKLTMCSCFFGRMVLGPFLNLAYDTEFTRQPELPRRKILRGRAGMKLFEGTYLREIYTGLVTEQEHTYRPARTKYAAEAGFEASIRLPGTALTLNADGNYRNFARSRLDTAADLKQRLELNLKFSTKLYGDVVISPFVNFFLATSKTASGTATNIMTGFSLNYSRLFKLKY